MIGSPSGDEGGEEKQLLRLGGTCCKLPLWGWGALPVESTTRSTAAFDTAAPWRHDCHRELEHCPWWCCEREEGYTGSKGNARFTLVSGLGIAAAQQAGILLL